MKKENRIVENFEKFSKINEDRTDEITPGKKYTTSDYVYAVSLDNVADQNYEVTIDNGEEFTVLPKEEWYSERTIAVDYYGNKVFVDGNFIKYECWENN